MRVENDKLCMWSHAIFKTIDNFHDRTEYFEPEIGDEVPCPCCGLDLTVLHCPSTKELLMLPEHEKENSNAS